MSESARKGKVGRAAMTWLEHPIVVHAMAVFGAPIGHGVEASKTLSNCLFVMARENMNA